MKDNKIYVVGHKNPDTDSICSAIAYANLKNKISGTDNYVPKRAGRVSSETKFVLNYFGFEAPEFVETLEPRMRDVEMRKTAGINEEASLKKAYMRMKEEGLRTLPVFSSDGELTGLITQGDIAHSMMEDYSSSALSNSRVSCRNILETLDGELLVGDIESVFEEGKVTVGAANPEKMTQFIEPKAMVIMGNRSDAQISALEKGAEWLIVGLGSEIFDSIKALARDKGCNIIVSPHDTYTITRLINQSMPVRHVMYSGDLVCFRDTDFVKDVMKIITKRRLRYFPVIDKDNNICGLVSQRNLLDMKTRKVILVDHNEKTQSPEGIDSVEILEIIDHHRIGGFTTTTPVYFRNQPLGCTCTIVSLLYRENGIEITREMAGLLCSAILSDTLCFRSPTCTETDERIARELAELAGIVPEEYAMEMFSAGSEIKDKSDQDILYQDFKKFRVGNMDFGVGQVSIMGDESIEGLKQRMLEYIPIALANSDYDAIFLMLTDILKSATLLVYLGKSRDVDLDELVSTAFNVKAEGEFAQLPGVVSRKKQLMPALLSAVELM